MLIDKNDIDKKSYVSAAEQGKDKAIVSQRGVGGVTYIYQRLCAPEERILQGNIQV